jgi:hypothetical protein
MNKRFVFIQDTYTNEAVVNLVSDIFKQLKIKHRKIKSEIEVI